MLENLLSPFTVRIIFLYLLTHDIMYISIYNIIIIKLSVPTWLYVNRQHIKPNEI